MDAETYLILAKAKVKGHCQATNKSRVYEKFLNQYRVATCVQNLYPLMYLSQVSSFQVPYNQHGRSFEHQEFCRCDA